MNPILDRLFSRQSLSTEPQRGPADSFWYEPLGQKVLSGVTVTDNTALTYSAVWACTRLLSGSGGGLPLNLYRSLPGGGKEIARTHPLQQVLHDAPNGEMSSMMFRSTALAQQINRGNCYAEIERDVAGRVRALWPIHASRVEPKRDDQKQLSYDVKTNEGKEVVRFPARDILHVPSMMSEDGITGKGVITVARESVGMGLATERHGAAFFGNGARPGIIVTHPQKLSDPARANFRREWREIHQGPDNAHNLALLQEGADAKIISTSPEDAQFLQTRQHNIEEICRWYGVPPHLVQHLLQATFNNIEHMGIEFVIFSLIPWLKLWEQEIWRKLLTPAEQQVYYAKHVVDALLRGDAVTRTAALQQQFFNGALTLNEWREIEDRNPLPDDLGAQHFVQASMIPLERLVNGPPAPQTGPPAAPEENRLAGLLAVPERNGHH